LPKTYLVTINVTLRVSKKWLSVCKYYVKECVSLNLNSPKYQAGLLKYRESWTVEDAELADELKRLQKELEEFIPIDLQSGPLLSSLRHSVMQSFSLEAGGVK